MVQAPAIADKVFQIAYVVPDIHAAIRFFKDRMGVRTFLVKEDIRVQEQTYLGRAGDYRQSIAFGFIGDMQIELIQPLSGVSSYSEFLARHPQGGIQHLGILVENYDAAVDDMRGRGFSMVQSGRNGDTRFAYFDTADAQGALMEVVYLAPPERAGFERMRRGEA